MGMGGNGNGNGFVGMGGNGNGNSPSRTPLLQNGWCRGDDPKLTTDGN